MKTPEQPARIRVGLVFEVGDDVLKVGLAILEVCQKVGCPIPQVFPELSF